jgi:tRNA A37 threonylcarbamoyltransferase TsaD
MMQERLPAEVIFPDIKLCTDNGAMIAASGYFLAGQSRPADPLSLEIQPNLSM